MKEGTTLPYKQREMPQIVIPILTAKIIECTPPPVLQQRLKSNERDLVSTRREGLTKESSHSIKTSNQGGGSNATSHSASSEYKSTDVHSAQERLIQRNTSPRVIPTSKISNERWKNGEFSDSDSKLNSGGWENYSKEWAEDTSGQSVEPTKPTSVTESNLKSTSGGWDNYNVEGVSVEPSQQEIIQDATTSSTNNVGLSALPSQSITGIVDLPGHQSYSKRQQLPRDPSTSFTERGRDSHKSSYIGGKDDHNSMKKFQRDEIGKGNDGSSALPGYSPRDRKRSGRDFHHEDDNRYKRSCNMDSSERTGESLGRGRGRTLPAWMSKDSQPGGLPDNPGRETKERSAQPRPSDNINNFNSTLRNNESTSLGRGRNRTMPAWIAKESEPVGNTHAINGTREGRDNVERSRQSSSSRSMNGFDSAPQEARGRGKGRTLPAWMTNKSVALTSTSSASSQPAQHAPSAAMPPNYERPSYQNSSRSRDRQQTVNIGRGAPDEGKSDSSFGRGRGRTLPAWMTKNNAAGPVTNTLQATGTQSYSQQAPRGQRGGIPGGLQSRGRGKDRTLPSWMTKPR